MEDREIVERIGNLAEEERVLEETHAADGLGDDDLARLRQLEETLDQLWDLLRQRRALRDSGRSPDEAIVRPADTVEKYLQ